MLKNKLLLLFIVLILNLKVKSQFNIDAYLKSNYKFYLKYNRNYHNIVNNNVYYFGYNSDSNNVLIKEESHFFVKYIFYSQQEFDYLFNDSLVERIKYPLIDKTDSFNKIIVDCVNNSIYIDYSNNGNKKEFEFKPLDYQDYRDINLFKCLFLIETIINNRFSLDVTIEKILK